MWNVSLRMIYFNILNSKKMDLDWIEIGKENQIFNILANYAASYATLGIQRADNLHPNLSLPQSQSMPYICVLCIADFELWPSKSHWRSNRKYDDIFKVFNKCRTHCVFTHVYYLNKAKVNVRSCIYNNVNEKVKSSIK